MAGRALLSRISGDDTSDAVRSIVAHLQVLLNTRKGDAVCAPEFGVVDFIDMVHSFPGSIQQLVKAIRATILEYEPRLKNVTVRHVPEEDSLTLRFEISAQLANDRSNRMLRVSTTVRPGGRYDVAG
jgi:type VI secretion system protein